LTGLQKKNHHIPILNGRVGNELCCG